MRKIILAFAVMLIASPAMASDSSDILKTLHTFMEAKPDVALTMCEPYAGVIDEFPPHAWQNCSDWFGDFGKFNAKNKITDEVIKLGTPKHIDVTGDRAYAVVPAEYDYKQDGKTMSEKGSVWTVALQKTKAGWRISGWSWSRM